MILHYFFKGFIMVLFASNKEIELLKWDNSPEDTRLKEYPIVNAADIAYDEDTISKYYSGMKQQKDGQRMLGFTRILTLEPFWKLKQNK